MAETARSIDLRLPDKLKNSAYRKRFFLAESSAKIASQLVALRKRRGLSQSQVATLAATKQPAISRVERADYNNWSFSALRAIADALDARIRVLIEPAEDILSDYDDAPQVSKLAPASPDVINSLSDAQTVATVSTPLFGQWVATWQAVSGPLRILTEDRSIQSLMYFAGASLLHKSEELTRLRNENERLKSENNLLSIEVSRLKCVPIYPAFLNEPRIWSESQNRLVINPHAYYGYGGAVQSDARYIQGSVA